MEEDRARWADRGNSVTKRRRVPWAPVTKCSRASPCSPHILHHLEHHILVTASEPQCVGATEHSCPGVGCGLWPVSARQRACLPWPGLPRPGPGAGRASWPCFSAGCNLPSPAPRASLRTCCCAYCSSRAAQRGSCSAHPWPPQTPSYPGRPAPWRSCCPAR